MITIITGILAIILAIPTFGISIVLWIYLKYASDKLAAKSIYELIFYEFIKNSQDVIVMGNYIEILPDPRSSELRHINNAALTLIFDMYGGNILLNEGSKVSGILPYPPKNIIAFITLTQKDDNALEIAVHSFEKI